MGAGRPDHRQPGAGELAGVRRALQPELGEHDVDRTFECALQRGVPAHRQRRSQCTERDDVVGRRGHDEGAGRQRRSRPDDAPRPRCFTRRQRLLRRHGRTLTYSWKQLSGPTVSLADSLSRWRIVHGSVHRASAVRRRSTPSSSRPGTDSRRAYDQVTVVNDPWGQAVANAGPHQTVSESAAKVHARWFRLVVACERNADVPVATAERSVGDAVEHAGAKPTFVPPNIPYAGGAQDLTFQLIVNDGFSTSLASTVTVTVTPVPEHLPGAPDQCERRRR